MKRRFGFTLGAPWLLAALGFGCGAEPQPDAWQQLRDDFPDHAAAVLDTERGFTLTGDSLSLEPDLRSPWNPRYLSVEIPRVAGAPIVMRDGHIELRVSEQLAFGVARVQDGTVSYSRDGGRAYWAGTHEGVEEWLVIDGGVSSGREPVARWQVEGGLLQEHDDWVDVLSADDGKTRMRVTAPAAYAHGGEELALQLRVSGEYLELLVEPSEGPVLVDPTWIDLSTMVAGRQGPAVTRIGSGDVVVFGGQTSLYQAFDSAETYDAALKTWSATTGLMTDARAFPSATLLANNTVFVAGGWDGAFTLTSTDIYDPNTGLFASQENMFEERAEHTATMLSNGLVLLCGGASVQASLLGNEVCGTTGCELFDPSMSSGQFGFTGAMNDYRGGHGGSLLSNGQVLMSGGEDCGNFVSSAEIYDPGMGTFALTGSMSVPRAYHTDTVLCNGDVLVTGGTDGNTVHNTAELWSGGTWTTTTGTMTTPRAYHTATLMSDCTVLLVGGQDNVPNALASAEIYDPNSQTFSATVPITGARRGHVALELLNGNVLAAGGNALPTPVNTSMEFTVNLKSDGQPCTIDNECSSMNCVDTVCCDTACNGVCEACVASLKGSGNDGVCEPILAGNDPELECPAAVCVMDSVDNADACNGSGACADGGTTTCGSYTCQNATCLTTCTTSGDCASTAYCDTVNTMCVPKKMNGDPATDPEQCISSFVADGVCCDTACDLGVCDACTVALGATTDGTCASTLGDCDDSNECTVDACDPAMGCGSSSKLDGTPCTGGVCIAGQCVPDPDPSTSGSGGSTSSSGAGAGGDNDNSGDPEFDSRNAELVGSGICSTHVAGGPARHDAAWLLAVLGLAALRRRQD